MNDDDNGIPTGLRQKFLDYFPQYQRQRAVLEDAKKNAYSDDEAKKIEEKIQYLEQTKEWLKEQVKGIGEVFDTKSINGDDLTKYLTDASKIDRLLNDINNNKAVIAEQTKNGEE